VDAGHFMSFVQTEVSDGFLVSSAYYGQNVFGLILLLALVGGESLSVNQLFYFYNALHIFSVACLFGVFLSTLNKSLGAVILWITTFFVFYMFDLTTGIFLGSNSSEEPLFVAMALVIYFLLTEDEDYNTRFSYIFFSSSFMMITRNYSIYYIFIITIICFLCKIYQEFNKVNFSIFLQELKSYFSNISSWLIFFCFLILITKEVLLVIIYGPFFPRDALVDVYPYTLDSFISGVGSGLSLFYWKVDNLFNPRSIYLIPIFLVLFIFLRFLKSDRKRAFFTLGTLLPLVFILMPWSLEILTQYRKNLYFSKLYVPIIMLPVWFPAYFFSRVLSASKRVVYKYLYITLICSVLFLMINKTDIHYFYSFQYIKKVYVGFLNDRASGIVRYPRHEQKIVELLNEKYSKNEMDIIKTEKIMYFHYEPGIGMRYYLGGDILDDLDFWSPKILSIANKSNSLEDFLCKTEKPNLVLFGTNRILYDEISGFQTPMILKEEILLLLQNKVQKQIGERFVAYGNFLFYRTDKTNLDC